MKAFKADIKIPTGWEKIVGNARVTQEDMGLDSFGWWVPAKWQTWGCTAACAGAVFIKKANGNKEIK